VGTRCFYRNGVLRLEGWGVIAEPRDALNAAALPLLTPWIGTLSGPVDPGQAHLDRIAPGSGTLPGTERYMVVAAYMLTVEDDTP